MADDRLDKRLGSRVPLDFHGLVVHRPLGSRLIQMLKLIPAGRYPGLLECWRGLHHLLPRRLATGRLACLTLLMLHHGLKHLPLIFDLPLLVHHVFG